MLVNKYRLPFLAPPDDESAGTGTASEYAGVAERNSLSSSRPVEDRSTPGPTPMGMTTGYEGLGPEEPGESGDAGSSDDITIPDNIFADDFDVSSLPPALQTPVQAAREQYINARKQLPGNDLLQEYALKAQGFDRIVNHDGFRRFMDEHPEYFGPGSSDTGDTPTPSVRDIKDPVIQNMVKHFDEDQVEALQSYMDSVIGARVQPIAQSYYKDKAEASLNALVDKYGEELWKKHEGETYTMMREYGLPAEVAFRSVLGGVLFNREQSRKQDEIKQKALHAPLGNGSVGTTPAPVANKKPKNFREAVLQAEEMYERKEGFDPRQYMMHAGRV